MFSLVNTKEEIKEVADKAEVIWNEHFTPIIGKQQVDYMLARFLSETAITEAIQEGYQFYQIQHLGKLVGFFSIHIEESLFLSKLYVEKAARGLKLASKAMLYIEQLAKENKCKSIWLTCNKYNETTIAIYQKMGFEIFDSVVNDIGNGYVMDDYYLRKML